MAFGLAAALPFLNRRHGTPGTPAFDPLTRVGTIVYTPDDWSTVFTDTAKTTAVTAAGQTARAMNDVGTIGAHLTTVDAAASPIVGVDAGGRQYLSFDAVSKVMTSVSTLSISAPMSIAAMLVPEGGLGTDIHPFVWMGRDFQNGFRLGTRPSHNSARAQARILSQGVSNTLIDGTAGDFVAGAMQVHHNSLSEGGTLTRGLDGSVMYSVASDWDTETLTLSNVSIGGPPQGGVQGNNFKVYGIVIMLNTLPGESAAAIEWLQERIPATVPDIDGLLSLDDDPISLDDDQMSLET